MYLQKYFKYWCNINFNIRHVYFRKRVYVVVSFMKRHFAQAHKSGLQRNHFIAKNFYLNFYFYIPCLNILESLKNLIRNVYLKTQQ